MVEKTLNELKRGKRGRIVKITGRSSLCRRMLDFGPVKNAKLGVKRVAPLGDPVEIQVKLYRSLHKVGAANVCVEVD